MAEQPNTNHALSLVNPDFSGLFSTAHLHNKENALYKTMLAFLATFILLFSWIFGYVLVVVNLLPLYYAHYVSFALLALALYTPYVFRLPRTPWFARFLKRGASYFEGCSWSFDLL